MITQSGKEKILYNGKIITVDREFNIAEAVSIRDGRFLAVGPNQVVKASVRPDAEMIDLARRTVIPGLIDSHVHMLWTALERGKLSVAGARTIDDLLDIIGDACKATGPGEWIETSQVGFEPAQLREGRSPNRWELDRVSPNNPVIHEEDIHYSVVNSYALKVANITKCTPHPVGGKIFKDPDNGEPTGWLAENALNPIKVLLRRPSLNEKVKLLQATMKEFNALGITSVIDTQITMDEAKVYRELWDNKKMTVRAKIMLAIHPVPGCLNTEQIELGPAAISKKIGIGDAGDEMLRIDGLKTLIEGGIQGKFMREPHMLVPGQQEDPTYRGITIMPRETFEPLSRMAAKSGWRLGVHCSGDAAIDLLLDIWEKVNAEAPIVDKHWVLIHGLLALPEHFDRIKELGVHVACQTAHVYTMGASMVKWWGSERANRAAPIKTFLKNGIKVGGGSDGYVCEWNPKILMWFDITRQSKWAGVLGSAEAITREESLVYHTINAACISDDDDKQGSIEPGKLADLVVLDNDILTCPVDEIKDTKVVLTMVDGQVVYEIR